MKLSFNRGQKGFTLIEIIIVLAVLGILAAIVVPSVTGFVSQSKARGWDADRHTLLVAVNGWRADVKEHPGNPWPVSDNRTLGAPTDNKPLDCATRVLRAVARMGILALTVTGGKPIIGLIGKPSGT